MKTSIKKWASFSVIGCLGIALSACGGGRSVSDGYSSGSSSGSYSSGTTQQWADYFSIVGGYSNGLTGYSTPYVDMGYVAGEGLNNDGYQWGYGSYKTQYKQVQHKLISGICESGSVDADFLYSDYSDGLFTVSFNRCKTSMGTLNGYMEQEVIGDEGGMDGTPRGAADVYTKYDNLSIELGASSYTINGTIIQYLEWDYDRQLEQAASNDLKVSVADNGFTATFEYSHFKTTVTADLTSSPAQYRLSEDFTAYISSPEYNGTISLVTVEPVVINAGGAVVSNGRQILTDDSGEQIVLKKK